MQPVTATCRSSIWSAILHQSCNHLSPGSRGSCTFDNSTHNSSLEFAFSSERAPACCCRKRTRGDSASGPSSTLISLACSSPAASCNSRATSVFESTRGKLPLAFRPCLGSFVFVRATYLSSNWSLPSRHTNQSSSWWFLEPERAFVRLGARS